MQNDQHLTFGMLNTKLEELLIKYEELSTRVDEVIEKLDNLNLSGRDYAVFDAD